MVFPENLQNSEAIEASINQHFALLHGILQLQEIKLIEKLHEQRNNLTRNIEQVRQQLKQHEEQLQSGIIMISTVSNNFVNVNLKSVIDKLNEMANAPCHILRNPFDTEENIELDIDTTIIDALKNHCKIKVPEMPKYDLISTDKLPDNYILEPLIIEERLMPRMTIEEAQSASLGSTTISAASPLPDEDVNGMSKGGLRKGCAEQVIVTHVNNPTDFYVHPISSQKLRISLDAKIADYVLNKDDTSPKEIVENKLYIVQSEDNNWYRGRVTKINEEPNDPATYEIFFVDFGFTEDSVPASKIKNIAPHLMEIPPLAFQCSLEDIVPTNGEWSEEVLKFTKQVMKEVDLRIIVKDIQGSLHVVHMSKYPSSDGRAPLNIREWLAFTCTDVKRLPTESLKKMNPNSVQHFYKSPLKMRVFEKVKISHIESPSCMYVQLQGSVRDSIEQHLHKFNIDMQNDKSTKEYPIYDFPYIGSPCAVQTDNKWHRGLVTGIPGQQSVEVFLVDVGSKTTVNYRRTRKLPSRYTNFTTQAIEIKLRDVMPLESDNSVWGPRVNDFLKDTLTNQIVNIISQNKNNDVFEIDMYMEDIYVNQYLVTAGFAKSTTISSCPSLTTTLESVKKKAKKQQKNQKKQEEKKGNKVAKKNADDNDLFKIRIQIAKVESPDSIYVHVTSAEETYQSMQKEMNEFYSNREYTKKPELELNVIYSVFSNKDKSYLRGKLMEICDQDAVIYFVDLGLEEVVSIDVIYPLADKFAKVPKLIFKIKIAGISPCGGTASWLSTSCRFLKETICDNSTVKFYISKTINGDKLEKGDGPIPVDLWMKKIEVTSPLEPDRTTVYSISRMLIDEGLAIPIRGYAEFQDQLLAIEFKKQLGFNDAIFNHEPSSLFIKHKLMSEIGTDSHTDADDDSEDSDEKSSVWLRPVLPPEKSFEVKGSYVDEKCFLYVQTNNNQLQFIENKLQEYMANFRIKSRDLEWKEGDICIARYHGTGKWYRAKVLQVKDENSFTVIYVDYGNTEDVSLGDLKKRVILRHIPVQCMKLKIAGLRPGRRHWLRDDLDRIHKLLVDKQFTVFPLDEKADGDYIEAAVVLHNQKMELREFILKKMLIAIHIDNIEVESKESEDKNGQANDDEKEDEKEEETSDTENNTPTDPNSLTAENDLVLSSDGVLETSEQEANEVQMNEVIASGSMANIDEADLDSSEDLPSIGDLALSDRNAHNAPLRTSTPQDDIGDPSPSDDEESNDVPALETAITSLDFKQLETLKFLEIEPGEMYGGVSFAGHLLENSQSTYLQEVFENYSSVMEEMQMTAHTQPLAKPAKGNACCAMFTDGIWYRCIILKIDENTTLPEIPVRILFVDFGNIITTDAKQLRAMKDEWCEVPMTSIILKLWNIKVSDTSKEIEACHELAALLGECRYVMSIKKLHPDYTVEVEFFDDSDPESLAYQGLIDRGVYTVVPSVVN